MKISPDIFQAYLKCPTKCWLRAAGETSSENAYAEWVKTQDEAYLVTEAARLIGALPNGDVATSPDAADLKSAKWKLATNVMVQASGNSWSAESHLHVIESIPAGGRVQVAQFIPIRFNYRNKLPKDDKLLLAFDAFVLSETLGRDIALGKIIHGDPRSCAREGAAYLNDSVPEQQTMSEYSTHSQARLQAHVLKVKVAALVGEVRKRAEKITALLTSEKPPDLVLNRHCPECEFQVRCRQKAIETDDLSLLAGMSAKERQKLRSKGIFTVTQLSYTFRPRRTPKRAKNPAKPRYPALQALAIRENTVFFHGKPTLPNSNTQVYLDIEGLPDHDFCYLIGALVVSEGRETFHSFWADAKSNEANIFGQLLQTLTQLDDYVIFHFGDYDISALKRVTPDLSECQQKQLEAILARSTNVLSAIYPHVYFPTYSNTLKDIGRLLGGDCVTKVASGLSSIIWRTDWDLRNEDDTKTALIEYNRADCVRLKCVSEFVLRHVSEIPHQEDNGTKVSQTKEAPEKRPYWQLFGPKKYALEEFGRINKRAYFDYQREKVFVRTHKSFRAINRQHRNHRKTSFRPNEHNLTELNRCPKCGSGRVQVIKTMSHTLLDLKFFRAGVKKWVIDSHAFRYRCSRCQEAFSSEARLPNPQRLGHNLLSWALYWNLQCGLNMSRVAKSLGDVFGIYLDTCGLYRSRGYTVRLYESLYAEILTKLLRKPVVHVDETTVRLSKGAKGYVWVLTSLDAVYYCYRPSREGAFLEELLTPFTGVLVSDFYTAYDSLPCEQQKCLAHLVRDIDDDLLKNPLDSEFKGIATDFGTLLKAIVQTVDRYGLKKRYLHRHKRDVNRFLKSVGVRNLVSELALKYQKRFQKSGSKMFTFLEHDGVPWNNNNAEHAIKRFAKYRRDANGKFTEASLREYLVLASVLETCEFNNVNVLDFLRSGETTLDGLLKFNERTKNRRSAVRNAAALESASSALPSNVLIARPAIDAGLAIVCANPGHTLENSRRIITAHRKWRLEVTEPRSVSCLGGLIAIEGLIRKFDIWTRLKFERPRERSFQAATGESGETVITQLVYSFCAGGVTLEDAEAIGRDVLLKYIAGAAGFARKSTLQDWLSRQDQARVERLCRLNTRLVANVVKSCCAARRQELERSLLRRAPFHSVNNSIEMFPQSKPHDGDKLGLHGGQCLYALADIAHNLLAALKLLYLPDSCLQLSPPSLRHRAIFLPAEMLYHARAVRVRVHVPKDWQGWWQRLVEPLGIPVESS